MSYEDLVGSETIRPHGLTPEQQARRLAEMLSLARQHLADAAQTAISRDARYSLAYAAARVAAEAVMLAEGYRPGRGPGGHAAVFTFLRRVDNPQCSAVAAYLDAARRKRNVAEYERPGTVTTHELQELATEAAAFVAAVCAHLAPNHEQEDGTA